MKEIKFSDLKKANVVLASCPHCLDWHFLSWEEDTLIMKCDMPIKPQVLFNFSKQSDLVNELCITMKSPVNWLGRWCLYSREFVIPISEFEITIHSDKILLETLIPNIIRPIPMKLAFLKERRMYD